MFVRRILWPIVWWLVTRALTADTRLGRKIMAFRGGRTSSPLIRLTPSHILSAGVERAPPTAGVADGKPRLADGRILDVAAVVWATGFRPDFGWIKLPIFDADGYPVHHRGVVVEQPGLYFLGLPFQHTLVSEMILGAVHDARYIADHLRTRSASRGALGVGLLRRPTASPRGE
jgi:putative flavoprotein involved in K+ transport